MNDSRQDEHASPSPTAPSRQRSRIVWSFADQALSSLTNAALSIVVARQVSRDDFGAFSLTLLVFMFVMGINRAMVADPYVINFSAASRDEQRRAARQATGAAAVNGLLVGVACAAAAMLQSGPLRLSLLALALTIPLILVQDIWRFVFFAQGDPRSATVNDLVWTVVQFTAIGALLLAGMRSVFLLVLAWGLAAGVAAAVGCLQTRSLPVPSAAVAWLRDNWSLSSRLGGEILLGMGSTNIAFAGLTAVVGLAAVGAIRGAQVLLGPLQLFFSGINAFALPWLTREHAAGRSVVRGAVLASAAAAVVATGWVGVLLALPPGVGQQLLGDSWATGRSMLLPVGLLMILTAATIGGALALKSLARSGLMLAVTAVQGPLTIGLSLLGATLSGAVAAAYGFAGAQLVGFVLIWTLLLRVTRTTAATRSATDIGN